MSIRNVTPESRTEHSVRHDRSTCVFCRNFREFDLPDHLLEQLSDRRLVIFAGAGVSTEASTVYPLTLYEEIRADLNLSEVEKPAFPKLMTMYCRQPDGRQKLLQKLQQRFAYVSAFPELYQSATRFHRELSTIFYVDTIITTNWDDYFERECGAIPFVTPEDFAVWNVPGRKVFKINGSINNPGSIVATEEDYRDLHEEAGIPIPLVLFAVAVFGLAVIGRRSHHQIDGFITEPAQDFQAVADDELAEIRFEAGFKSRIRCLRPDAFRSPRGLP